MYCLSLLFLYYGFFYYIKPFSNFRTTFLSLSLDYKTNFLELHSFLFNDNVLGHDESF